MEGAIAWERGGHLYDLLLAWTCSPPCSGSSREQRVIPRGTWHWRPSTEHLLCCCTRHFRAEFKKWLFKPLHTQKSYFFQVETQAREWYFGAKDMVQVAFPHPPSHHPNHSLQRVRGTPASAQVGDRPRSNPPSSNILAQVTQVREALPRKMMGSPEPHLAVETVVAWLQGEEAPPSPLLSLRTGVSSQTH